MHRVAGNDRVFALGGNPDREMARRVTGSLLVSMVAADQAARRKILRPLEIRRWPHRRESESYEFAAKLLARRNQRSALLGVSGLALEMPQTSVYSFRLSNRNA